MGQYGSLVHHGVDGPPPLCQRTYDYHNGCLYPGYTSPGLIHGLRGGRNHLPTGLCSLSRCTLSTCHRRMRYSRLRSSHYLLLPHPLQIHQGYVPESDLEEDDEDPDEDPADYPADRDDDDDDEDEDEDEDEEEEEEHPAPADSVPPVHRMTARISIRDEPSISLPPRERTDRPEITLPPRKRLGIDLGPRYEIRESSAAATTRPIGGRRADYGFVGTMDTEIRRQRAEEVGYGIRDVWVDPREAVEEVTLMTLEGVNARVTELTAVQEQDTQDIYAVIEDTQDRQTQIYQSVETLFDDSQYHYETARLLDQEALVSREAWGCSIEVSYMTRSEIMALRSVVMGQQAVISQLQAADRKSQVVTLEMLQADYQRQVQLTKALKLLKGLQTQMVEFQRQHGPAKGPAQPDAPGEAGSSS
ncbi:hypothetical protein Tco_0084563 [Tanacetum coccineum]